MTNGHDLDDSGEFSFELAEGFAAPEAQQVQRVPTPTSQQWPALSPADHEPATDVVVLTDAMLASLSAPPRPIFAPPSLGPAVAVDDALEVTARPGTPAVVPAFPRGLPMALPAFRAVGPSTDEALRAVRGGRSPWPWVAGVALVTAALFGGLLWSELREEAPAPAAVLVASNDEALAPPPLVPVPEEPFAPFPETRPVGSAPKNAAPTPAEPPAPSAESTPNDEATKPAVVPLEAAEVQQRKDAGPPTVRAVRAKAKSVPQTKSRASSVPSVDLLDAWQ